MGSDPDKSLSDEATFAGAAKRGPGSEVSIGDDRTLGDNRSGQDTVIDDIEVVDLEARYKVEGTLGQGGMGAVLLATDTRLDRKVAIKRILGEAASNRMAVQRFLTEAKAIAALNHPNIVQIYDYGRAKDGPFLIMEYVDGGSLLDKCRESALPLDEAIDLACQLCDGLAKAHDLGIVHRDIKPANVLLTKDGTPKLTDFGLAKAQASDHGQTMTGAVLGTPDFMPPEQRRDASLVDHRSDLWSLAATIYQMVTGRSPKIIRFKDVPESLQDVLGKALEDIKDSRYQTARELRDALKSVGVGAVAVPSGEPAVADELHEGQCKACGTVTSDLTKKFCRNPKCGASLRVACLKCDAQIPVWDGVCGECGGNQPALIDARYQSLAAEQAKAEELAASLAFGEALECATKIASDSRPEFAQFVAWAMSFVDSTTKEWHRLQAVAHQTFDDARRHAAAHDYPSAIHTLEKIPKPLRDTSATSLLSECQSRQAEAGQLIAEIADRINRKELAGLLPRVERASALRGDRQDLAKILRQLQERRDSSITRAKQALESGDLQRAIAAFSGLTAADFSRVGSELFEQVQQALALEIRLIEAVATAKSDGVVTPEEAADLLDLCQSYLKLNPNSAKIRSLATRCHEISKRFLIEREQAKILATRPVQNSIGMKLKLLPAGTFTMGQNVGALGETAHEVTLTKPFYLGLHEVTNVQWKQVMGRIPSADTYHERPAEQVSWGDAVEFCRKLSALPDERKAGRIYRLPTEAEWEYACRAGTTTTWSFGDDRSQLDDYGWYEGNSGGHTHPVGQKKPNPWGLYDMHGNVWEWCSDWYGRYTTTALTDPKGHPSATERILRGGAWGYSAERCRSAYRRSLDPSNRNNALGLRVAMSVPEVDLSNESANT